MIEIATGLALVAAPSVVLDALIGSSTADASVVGRVLGGALLALGIGGWLMDPRAPGRGIPTAFFVYNASTAATLALAGSRALPMASFSGRRLRCTRSSPSGSRHRMASSANHVPWERLHGSSFRGRGRRLHAPCEPSRERAALLDLCIAETRPGNPHTWASDFTKTDPDPYARRPPLVAIQLLGERSKNLPPTSPQTQNDPSQLPHDKARTDLHFVLVPLLGCQRRAWARARPLARRAARQRSSGPSFAPAGVNGFQAEVALGALRRPRCSVHGGCCTNPRRRVLVVGTPNGLTEQIAGPSPERVPAVVRTEPREARL